MHFLIILLYQVVVGPPGSGKTTYCAGMSQVTIATGRKSILVNLDFANDEAPLDPLDQFLLMPL